MEIFTTLLLIIGLLILWAAQRNSKKEAEKSHAVMESIPHHKNETFINESETTHTDNIDIKDRHIKSGLVETQEIETIKRSSIDIIESLPRIKRSIIWAEILDKPVSER